MNRNHDELVRLFASDNASGVHPRIIDAMNDANRGHCVSYGADPYTRRAQESLRRLAGARTVDFLYNGTGANIVALGISTRPYNSVVCSEESHIATDECGAAERFTGCKLMTVRSRDGKLAPSGLDGLSDAFGVEHHVQPAVLSVSQSTELGTVYRPDELLSLTRAAHAIGLSVHVDGARIANAAVCVARELGCSPRDAMHALTRDAEIDLLSFGGTKNGAMFGEALVSYRELSDLKYVRKQAAQLASKMRFIAAQFEALVEDDLWFRNASASNDAAQRLAEKLARMPELQIVYPVDANAVFARMPRHAIAPAQAESFFYVWDKKNDVVRFMTSFDTTPDDVDAFVAGIARAIADRETERTTESEATYSLDEFAKTYEAHPEILSEVLTIFLDETPAKVVSLRDAVAEGKLDDVVRIAHSFANTTGTLKADDALRAARAVENAARAGDVEAAKTATEVFCTEIDRVIEVVREAAR